MINFKNFDDKNKKKIFELQKKLNGIGNAYKKKIGEEIVRYLEKEKIAATVGITIHFTINGSIPIANKFMVQCNNCKQNLSSLCANMKKISCISCPCESIEKCPKIKRKENKTKIKWEE